ncbi:MAG TPA: methylated-DNA--[protein]-cysteine S-methyltransferase [Gaiellaceae bacterium]|nr:methylated-DNA--[protein]-cysteine S-methyltransferase [Gaiellaceae bacterium]
MGTRQVAYEVDGWGVGELVVADGRVVWHELPHPSVRTASRGSHEAAELVQAYFAGDDVELSRIPVDLEYDSPFFARCAEALRAIPRGEVVTYGELAALAGAPGAARAAGTFCARNRLGLFVPCHRVVAAGGLGSYGSYGIEYKRRLLELEGAL